MNKKNIFSPVVVLLFLSVLFLNCNKSSGSSGSGDGGGSSNTSNNIYMRGSAFSNTSLRITEGGTVTWINDDTMVHTVTANDGSFNSGDILPGNSYRRTFNTVGTFSYFCTYHSGMTGTIIVVTK